MMKKTVAVAVFVLAIAGSVVAQQKSEAAKPAATQQVTKVAALAQTAAKPAAAPAGKLEEVLNSMDKAAAGFQSVQTDFQWDQYSKIVDDLTVQKGTMYFRRQGKNIEMAADIKTTNDKPDPKYVLFTGGLVQVYQPKADQITKYNAGKNKADFESFLVLGFGGRGHDLSKSFDVKYAGDEQVGGVNASKLELTPKAERVRNMFATIMLWIDPARGISVQQKFQESSGDYRLAKYNNVKMNQKVPDSAFKIKTTGKTTVVTPQG